MNISNVRRGLEVVRSKGDYVVGSIGNVIDVDNIKQRAQVDWNNAKKTWVSADSIEPTDIPYEIIPVQYDNNGRRTSWAKYKLL
jgi:hypothetical protein